MQIKKDKSIILSISCDLQHDHNKQASKTGMQQEFQHWYFTIKAIKITIQRPTNTSVHRIPMLIGRNRKKIMLRRDQPIIPIKGEQF